MARFYTPRQTPSLTDLGSRQGSSGTSTWCPSDRKCLKYSRPMPMTFVSQHLIPVHNWSIEPMSMSGSISQPMVRRPHAITSRHGLYLVPGTRHMTEASQNRAGFLYRAAAVGAALFLAMTLC